VIRVQRTIAVGSVLDGDPGVALALTAVLPEARGLVDPPVAFFCVPGGGLDRGYFDLRPDGETRFSFAEQMGQRGYITLAIDPLGIGGSSRPARGFDLTPDVHALAQARLHAAVSAQLRDGRFTAALPQLPGLVCIGVGHSVGGMLTVFQQAAHRSFDALLLLGFGVGGMPEVLDEEMRAYSNDPAGVRANVARLARKRYTEPYPTLEAAGRGREIYGGGADRAALLTMRGCRAPLLATVAQFVILPGSAAPEAACVDVPLLLVAGDEDLCGPADLLPASFPGSPDVSVLELAGTGHSHLAFPSVDVLFPRIAEWALTVAGVGAEARA
jgi:alpha-beta hydrolase superfamily lysophospholipase